MGVRCCGYGAGPFAAGVFNGGIGRGRVLMSMPVTIKDLQTDFYLFTRCTDTGVIATHASSFYQPLAPLSLLTHAQLAVVTQSCALLYITAHGDLLLQ